MKIRTDYVTNSSSSSFILGFTNEDNIKYELHYNMKRLLDSALMGQYSVKSIDESKLYNMSLK